MIRKICMLIFVSILLAGCISSPAPEKGTLQLTSLPTGSEIYLDSQYRGTTPATVSGVEPGNHTLELRREGYRSWKAEITVPSGTSNFFAALSVVPGSSATETTPAEIPSSARVTAGIGRERMIIGESNLFLGTATGTDRVILTLRGPGYYLNGIVLDTVRPDAAGEWSFTWNPGTKIQQGTYTLVVQDAERTVSREIVFKAIGGGVVSVTPSSFAIGKGDTITFSGRCTTGAPEVRVRLIGPERFTGGIDLGTFPVLADQTWSYRFTTDSAMPTGVYTVYANDVPETASGTSQFTIGFVS